MKLGLFTLQGLVSSQAGRPGLEDPWKHRRKVSVEGLGRGPKSNAREMPQVILGLLASCRVCSFSQVCLAMFGPLHIKLSYVTEVHGFQRGLGSLECEVVFCSMAFMNFCRLLKIM